MHAALLAAHPCTLHLAPVGPSPLHRQSRADVSGATLCRVHMQQANSATFVQPLTILIYAVSQVIALVLTGSEKTVGLLLEKGADPGVVCQRGTTALHHAAENNRPEVLARLLQRAEEPLVRVQDALGWTALHYAAMHERCDCAAKLIQVCAPPWHCPKKVMC